MMEDEITLDHISTQSTYDLVKLFNDSELDEDFSESPMDIIDNTCNYYDPSGVKELLNQEKNYVSLFCLNCQGLRAHWDSFHNLVWETCGDGNAFDIIGITELYSMNISECALNGYHSLEYKTRNDTTISRGGIGLYIQERLQYDIRPDLSVFIPNVFESLFAEIHIQNKTISVGVVYRPNTAPQADIDIFMNTMQ